MAAPFNMKEDLEHALPVVDQDDNVPADSAASDHNGADAPATKRKIQRQRKRKGMLRGTNAALPDKHFGPKRDPKAFKGMANLLQILQTGFESGFCFPIGDIGDWIEYQEAKDLCSVLHLHNHPRDAGRIMGFMLSLVKAVKACRGKYKRGSGDNSEFFEAIARDVRIKGLVGGPKNLSTKTISTNTCKVMLECFVKARKAYFLAFPEDSQEGTYTAKTRDLLRILDAWLEFSKEDDDMENGLVEIMNDVGI
ncbi:hypothetical protein CGLO_04086 [Colletotrichum gloeosporioides Cg-14]|uniref:Uncharacterized protein n=1 Tax=Colletotrichum gloeosporioides (strain Cg-14) TaxID=1237896 RepID=T0KK42_COLGC|nr:hypothetical protein CGLO_04086 [Colletotrichum gloeosporioides Cg-14]